MPNSVSKLLEVDGFSGNQKANNETEQSKNRAKDLNNKNLDEPRAMSKQSIPPGDGFARTHKLASAASARAALLPLIPTETPHIRLHMPTVSPDQNSA